RVANLGLTSAGMTAFGLGLAAAGVLPRLEYNLVSNLPGGYPDVDVSQRAASWLDWGLIDNWDRLLLQPGFEYIGWPVLLLAIAAPLAWTAAHLRASAERLVARSAAPAARPFARQSTCCGAITMLPFFAVLGVAVLILARAEA